MSRMTDILETVGADAKLIDTVATFEILQEIANERIAQDAKWGQQSHPDGTGPGSTPLAYAVPIDSAAELAALFTRLTDRRAKDGTLTWRDILLEEVFEALAESDPIKLRTELLQIAAVAAAWAESIDRRADHAAGLEAVAAATKPRLTVSTFRNDNAKLTIEVRGAGSFTAAKKFAERELSGTFPRGDFGETHYREDDGLVHVFAELSSATKTPRPKLSDLLLVKE